MTPVNVLGCFYLAGGIEGGKWGMTQMFYVNVYHVAPLNCQLPIHRPNKGMRQKNALHAWNKIACGAGTLLFFAKPGIL